MKIAFVDGPWPEFGHRTQRWAHKNPGGNINPPPMFQMYACAVARQQGFEVELWDAPLKSLGFEFLVGEITAYGPRIVVVNTSTPSFDHDLKLIGMLKEKLDVVIVAVGPHVTALASEIMSQTSQLDVIALGEYDETIADIGHNLDNLAKVEGIAYRKDGEVQFTHSRELIGDLDSLPYPAWDKVSISDYWESTFPASKRPVATVMSSRGCNYHCSFCLYPHVLFKNKLRLRSLPKVIDEISWLKQEFGAGFFYFEDDNFTASWKRVEEFCHLLIQRKLDISWGCLSRTDGVTDKRLKLMKDSGCFLIKYGVESGSQEQLNKIDKRNELGHIVETFKLTRKSGIASHATIMLGTPGESRESICQTRQFVRKLAPDSVQFSICTPFPGTRFWDECKEKGWLDYECWEDFDGVSGGVLNYPQLSKKEIKDSVKLSYLNYYRSWPHIKQRLNQFILGTERMSQLKRNFWMLKRLYTVLLEMLKDSLIPKLKAKYDKS